MNLDDLVPEHSNDPFRHREYRWGRGEGGWIETTGKIGQFEITEYSLFYVSRIT